MNLKQRQQRRKRRKGNLTHPCFGSPPAPSFGRRWTLAVASSSTEHCRTPDWRQCTRRPGWSGVVAPAGSSAWRRALSAQSPCTDGWRTCRRGHPLEWIWGSSWGVAVPVDTCSTEWASPLCLGVKGNKNKWLSWAKEEKKIAQRSNQLMTVIVCLATK